jgi:hypothetical protein
MFQCTVRETRAEGKTVYYAVATRTELAVYGGAPGAPRALRVWRRFSEFEALHEHLCSVAGAGRLPPLPAKNVFAAFGGDKARLGAPYAPICLWVCMRARLLAVLTAAAAQIMEERRSAFESLMSYVGGDELLRQHPLVAEFVGASVCARLCNLFRSPSVRVAAQHALLRLRETVAGADVSAPRNAQPYPAAAPAAARCVAALAKPSCRGAIVADSA